MAVILVSIVRRERRQPYVLAIPGSDMDDDAPPGVPEWVVTYGDMMSLLLTFFIMLVSMSEVKADSKFRAVMEAFAQYLGYPTAAASPTGDVFPLNSLVERLDTLGSYVDDGNGAGGIKRDSLAGSDMRVLRNREGRPVPSGVVQFASGDPTLDERTHTEIRHIAEQLAGKPHKIDIVAFVAPSHDELEATPDLPNNTAARAKAFQRAKLVMNALESNGLRHERMRLTVNPGETHQLTPQTPSRTRVEVHVLDQFTTELVGPRSQ